VGSLFIGAARTGSGTRGGAGAGPRPEPTGHVVQGGAETLHVLHQLQAETNNKLNGTV
jgi:hypothetical protein